MQFEQVASEPKTFVIVFQTGDEVASGLLKVAREARLSTSSFKAIGAFSSVKLAWLNWKTRKYQPSVVLDEQVELLSLIGDITTEDEQPLIHAHAVVGKSDGSAHGGHLLEAYVRPTCEVILTESPVHLQRAIDPSSGLALIKL